MLKCHVVHCLNMLSRSLSRREATELWERKKGLKSGLPFVQKGKKLTEVCVSTFCSMNQILTHLKSKFWGIQTTEMKHTAMWIPLVLHKYSFQKPSQELGPWGLMIWQGGWQGKQPVLGIYTSETKCKHLKSNPRAVYSEESWILFLHRKDINASYGKSKKIFNKMQRIRFYRLN